MINETAVRELDGCAATLDESARLRSALSALIARVRRTGGYASPEEQDVLRAAEQVLAGVAEKPPGVPVVSAEPPAAVNAAGQSDEQASGRSGGDR